jgi:phosphoribulokinase
MNDGNDPREELDATLATLARLGRDVAYFGSAAADAEMLLVRGVLRRHGRRIAGLARQGARLVYALPGHPHAGAASSIPGRRRGDRIV